MVARELEAFTRDYLGESEALVAQATEHILRRQRRAQQQAADQDYQAFQIVSPSWASACGILRRHWKDTSNRVRPQITITTPASRNAGINSHISGMLQPKLMMLSL